MTPRTNVHPTTHSHHDQQDLALGEAPAADDETGSPEASR
jgi:hypothetical protein